MPKNVLDRNLAKIKESHKAKKLVNVCLHFSEVVQISLQFAEKFPNSNFVMLFDNLTRICWDTLYMYYFLWDLNSMRRIYYIR